MKEPSQRKLGVGANAATVEAQFNRADMLLQEVVCDITNGLTHNDIICKFKAKNYEHQKKPLGERQARNYITMAYLILADNRIEEREQLRDTFYNQYLMLYNDLVKSGESLAAKQVLDSMSKLFLGDVKDVNLNARIDQDITIDFNFEQDEG